MLSGRCPDQPVRGPRNGRVVKGGMARGQNERLFHDRAAPAAFRETARSEILATVRRGKTNQEGETKDVRFVKAGVARALRTLRAATSPAPDD